VLAVEEAAISVTQSVPLLAGYLAANDEGVSRRGLGYYGFCALWLFNGQVM